MKYSLLIFSFLLLSCGHKQQKPQQQEQDKLPRTENVHAVAGEEIEPTTDVDFTKESESEKAPEKDWRDTLYVRSNELSDSVWIKTLNRIPLPDSVKHNNINVYFKYKQPIKGHEVTARWMPFDPRYETGLLVMNFHNLKTGVSFRHYNFEKYNSINTDAVSFSKSFKGHKEGDVYYFSYIPPETYIDDWYDGTSVLGYYTPFQFLDIDFDGEDELLVSDWSRCNHGGNFYEVYDIVGNRLKEIESVPLKYLMTDSKIDLNSQTIELYEADGAYHYSLLYFSKSRRSVPKIKTPDLSYIGRDVVEEYAACGTNTFSLDSMYICSGDSIYRYRLVGNELKQTEKYKNPDYNFYN